MTLCVHVFHMWVLNKSEVMVKVLCVYQYLGILLMYMCMTLYTQIDMYVYTCICMGAQQISHSDNKGTLYTHALWCSGVLHNILQVCIYILYSCIYSHMNIYIQCSTGVSQ